MSYVIPISIMKGGLGMGYETLLLEKRGKVAVLTLNRPANNAVSYAMLGEIDRALDEVASDGEVRVLVITGCGEKSFCAGMDVADAVNTRTWARWAGPCGPRLTGSRSPLSRPSTAMPWAGAANWPWRAISGIWRPATKPG